MIYSECDKDLNISMKNKNIIIIIFLSILSFHFWTRKLKRTKLEPCLKIFNLAFWLIVVKDNL